MPDLKPGTKLRHFKGKDYEIICTARDSDTLEELIIYKGLYDSEEFGPNPIWTRPKKEFFDKKIVDGTEVSRFEIIE